MLDQLLIKYADHFGDNFPIFQLRNLDEKKIIELIKTAIENNELYKLNEQNDVVY